MSLKADLPVSAGVGFKPEHLGDILAAAQPVGFFEVHAENYMGAGGPPHAHLTALRERYPVSVHGVGLSIGSMQPLDRDHLVRLKRVCDRYQPASFSEHLAWSSHDGVYFNDLLPLPYTEATLARVAEHVDEVQTALGRQMLLENPSTYLQFRRKHHSGGRLPRRTVAADRLRAIARHQQCVRVGHQSRHFPEELSRAVSAGPGQGNPSRRA